MDTKNRKVYLDYNATTPLDKEVLKEISQSLTDDWANPSSGYEPGRKAKNAIETARCHVASMIDAKPNDIVFTSGGTEANNLVIHTALEHFRRAILRRGTTERVEVVGDKRKIGLTLPHFVTTTIEHDAIVIPLKHMEKQGLIEVSFVPVSKVTGRVEVNDVLAAIRPTTCLVTVMLANNETGVIQSICEIASAVRTWTKRNANIVLNGSILIHTDAAQAIGKIPVDVKQLGVDYLTIVGHKFYGPRIGALYVRELETECPLHPMMFGGGQERGYRPGTENTPLIVGLGKAAELVANNLSDYCKHFSQMKDYLEMKLLDAFKERVCFNNRFKDTNILPNTVNVSIIGERYKGQEVLAKCELIMASVGAACHSQEGPSAVLLASGISREIATNAIRMSVGRETTKCDIDDAVVDIVRATNKLSKLDT